MSKELEALENIKQDLEYITRLDYVEPIVRGEVRDNLFKIYHRELPELDIIETALKNYDELCQLKDIKEDLGIDPVTLFKALKEGFYYKKRGIIHTSKSENSIFLCAKSCLPKQMCIEVHFGDLETSWFYFDDYGKTWALTREELER